MVCVGDPRQGEGMVVHHPPLTGARARVKRSSRVVGNKRPRGGRATRLSADVRRRRPPACEHRGARLDPRYARHQSKARSSHRCRGRTEYSAVLDTDARVARLGVRGATTATPAATSATTSTITRPRTVGNEPRARTRTAATGVPPPLKSGRTPRAREPSATACRPAPAWYASRSPCPPALSCWSPWPRSARHRIGDDARCVRAPRGRPRSGGASRPAWGAGRLVVRPVLKALRPRGPQGPQGVAGGGRGVGHHGHRERPLPRGVGDPG